MTKAITSALDAVASMGANLRPGQLVTHADCPGEFFFVDSFYGEKRKGPDGFYWQVWVRGIEKHASIPFPARADELEPVTIN